MTDPKRLNDSVIMLYNISILNKKWNKKLFFNFILNKKSWKKCHRLYKL